MPQISIQIDSKTLKALERLAEKKRTSVSKWIKDRIRADLEQEWPKDYFSLFGSLDDDDLEEPGETPFHFDSKREQL